MLRTLLPAILMLAVAVLPSLQSQAGEKKPEAKTREATKEGTKKGIADQVIAGIADFYKATFEGELDLKVKSWSLVEFAAPGSKEGKSNHVRLLVEFTKDLDEESWYARLGALEKTSPHVEFYFFDDENVRLEKRRVYFLVMSRDAGFRTEGQITCKKGEAFRVYVPTSSAVPQRDVLEKTKRVEVHAWMPNKKS